MEAKESEISWFDDDTLRGSTKSPEVIEEGNQVTIAIFLIMAVATITLLFALGVFIDCRHQKIDSEEAERKRAAKLRLPKIKRILSKRTDKDCIIEDMEQNEASTSNGIV
ncbi:hypothetical protein HHI36_009315 [Cryptolaemus montrouzieri]|uniref:Uncharacterized protein n=1 Tax=Cryptolaemus montrouzieri TaxID=559131 RepID=A0ABD2MVR9_9CUCU